MIESYRMRRWLLFMVSVLISAGCSSFNMDWNPFYKPADIAQPVIEKPQEEIVEIANPYVDSGRIIHADKLSQGGNLLIIPFRAGPGVESNTRLDELSLKMIQGIAAELKDYRPYFQILTDQGKEEPDVILKGFFTEVGQDAGLMGWIPGKNPLESIRWQVNAAVFCSVYTDASAGVGQ